MAGSFDVLYARGMWGRMLLGAAALLAVIWWVTNPPVAAPPAPIAGSNPIADGPAAGPAHGVVERQVRELVVDAAAGHAPDAALQPRDVRAEEPAPRDVRVLDETQQPVPGARLGVCLVLRSNGEEYCDGTFATTDAGGRARMILRTGDLVGVTAPGFGRVDERVPAPVGEWVLVLPRALRLEIRVVGTSEFSGLHARVLLPRTCPNGSFYQTKYVQTPGRAVAGTVARWESEQVPRSDRVWQLRSFWDVGLSAAGSAVLDQIEGTGTVVVQLRRFANVLEERRFDIGGGPVHMQFEVAAAGALHGIVVDPSRRALPLVLLRMAPYGDRRIVDNPNGVLAFPCWAPETRSDPDGRFVLPRPDSDGERVVVTCPGYAARALTIAELDAAGGRIELAPGHAVRIEIRDCNGKPLDGGDTTGGHEYAEPSVLLGHDVWRGTDDRELPWFEFRELPPAVVTFRCAGETLRHDARVGLARLVTEGPVEEMGIGK